MAVAEEIIEHLAFLVRRSGAFEEASDDCIRSLAAIADWMTVPGGSTLFLQGDPSSSIFIPVSGLLGAYIRNRGDEEMLVGRAGPGEVIGEMGCVTGEPRSATIRALRNSEVLCIDWKAIEPIARNHPELLLSICRTVAGRLRMVEEGRPPQAKCHTYCLIPHGRPDDFRAFVDDLVAEFVKLGSTALVTKQSHGDYTTHQLFTLEAANDYVIFLGDETLTPWSRLCLGQADNIVVMVQGADPVRPLEPPVEKIGNDIPTNLVLLWRDQIVPGKTAHWLDAVHPDGHHHVRSRDDVGRVARLITGKGLGVVLSGGGARGLAHIGVKRAFSEQGLIVDAVVGTSIGALIGASIAMEWDHAVSLSRAHQFSRRHPLLELVLPRRSLLSGRNLRYSLEDWYGETGIEETPIRYACVSANLNTSQASIHQRGKLKTWLLASASLPGIFPPVLEDQTLYIDGGVVNNLPTDIIRDMGAGFVVGVDVGQMPIQASPAERGIAPAFPGIVEILMRTATMGSDARRMSARQGCDVLLNPDVSSIDLLDFRAYARAMDIGYQCAMEKIDCIRKRVADNDIVYAGAQPRHPGQPRFW